MSQLRIKLLRNVFLITFILATLFFCVVASITPLSSGGSSDDLAIISTIASLLTSVVTFLGFLITALISFRKEKREVRESELSQKQKEIELERARLELEQLKRQVNKKKK